MGWTFYETNGRTVKEILTAEFTQSANRADGSIQTQWEVIDSSTRGREWYAVIRTTNGGDGFVRHFGMVCLFTLKNDVFGYKDMGDECAPFYYNPPRRILDLLDKVAPNPEGGAKIWRDKCREKLAQKPRFKLCAGMDISYGGVIYKLIESAGSRRGWRVMHESGKTYRLPACAMAHAIPV